MGRSKQPQGGAIATNRRARHEYEIEQTFEAGIVLVGSEVKTLRAGKASLQDAYAVIRKGELFLYGVHIPEYPQASLLNHEPTRVRKLLLHGYEIAKLEAKTQQQGYTLVPLKMYFKENRVKVELGLARGKAKHDKRQALIKKEHQREMGRAAAAARRGDRRR